MTNDKTEAPRTPLKQLYISVRDAKKTAQISKILSAYKFANGSEFRSHVIPSTFHSVASLYTHAPTGNTNLIGELIWGSIVISEATSAIHDYFDFKQRIQAEILESRWSEAAALITAFELFHGAAVVPKELAIAVQQQSEGTIRQVAFSRRLQSQSGSGAVSNFLHFCSERNEDRLTLSSLRRTFRENYSEIHVGELVSSILHWHALRQIPSDRSILSLLLDYECAGSLFDYYEVYVAAAISLAFSADREITTPLVNSLRRLAELGDTRITNALAVAEQKFPSTPSTNTRSLYGVLSSFPRRTPKAVAADAPPLVRDVIEEFSRQKEFNTNTRRLVHKFGANFYFLNYFQAVFGHLEHKASPACFEKTTSPFVAAQFTTRSTNLLLACSPRHNEDSRHSILRGPLLNEELLIAKDAEARLADALILLAKRDVDSLIELISTVEDLNALDKTHLLLLTIKACIASKRFVDLLPYAFLVSEIRLDAFLLLEIIPALEQIYPKRLSQLEAATFSIVASRLLLLEDSDWIEDKLMVAAECALQNLDAPPDWYAEHAMNRGIWITFLHEVMEIQNMLLIDGVDSLRHALDLRLKILRQLIELNPDHKDEYQEEVRDITFNLSVEDGTKHINTSRLYVNVQGLQKWAAEHCQDDFERYKELVLGESFAGDLIVKSASSGGSILEKIANIPINAADDQLLTLLFRMRTAYLSDPRNGLDAFISLRVRHGSLAGTLSRGLDTRQLLLLRKGNGGSYEAPTAWIEQLQVQDANKADFIDAFARFAKTFHASIEELLRNRLRVRSEKNPDGMIAADVTDYYLKGLKYDIVHGLNFDSFLASVFLTYKNSISQYLAGLRDYLKGEFLRKSIEDLQNLSNDIEAAIGKTVHLAKIRDAITSARIDLQSSIKIVCGWLEIAQKDDLSQIFTLQQAAHIGINYTRQVRQDFAPNIKISNIDQASLRLTGTSLIAIVDVLFILLYNVYKHAGLPNDRKISLSFDLSEEGLIRIRMVNDVDPSKDLTEISTRLEAAKSMLADEESERKLTEEDKSGIPKLSRLVVQDRQDALSFNRVGNEVIFTVALGYSSLELPQ